MVGGLMFSRFFKLEPEAKPDSLQVGARSVPLLFVHHPRARRYLLRLQADGIARVTIPRRGSLSAARDFASRNIGWLEQQFQRLAQQPKTPVRWEVGKEIHFRGELVRIEVHDNQIRFGTEQIEVSDPAADLKPAIQRLLQKLAQRELPARVMELARLHGIEVTRVSVRNQRTRWGSCSRRGTISLNWRLVMTPAFVRDYIILHELTHRRQMNHSDKFWQEVERLCPDYPAAERWLKQHSKLLRDWAPMN
jgi:predicted metal-dependent hydrolase